MPTVILGSGIIGLSTAYYLSRLTSSNNKKSDIHLVDPCPELFASASGKAAGFLAKDWFAPAVTPLGELSFELHRQLAEEHNGRERWGWSESLSWSMDRDSSESGSEEDTESDSDYASAEGPSPDETNGGELGSASMAKTTGKNNVDESLGDKTGSPTTAITQGKTDLPPPRNNPTKSTIQNGFVRKLMRYKLYQIE